MKTLNLRIGRHVLDLLRPAPDRIDLTAIDRNLWVARRFSNNPKALLVRQHTHLASRLATIAQADIEVILWCLYHDDHEGIIGDIPGPLKAWINQQMYPNADLNDVEYVLDAAICQARNVTRPTPATLAEVHHFDKMAETIEWQFVLGYDPEPWNVDWRALLTPQQAVELAGEYAMMKPPPDLFY